MKILIKSVFVKKIKLKIEEIEENRRSKGDSVPIGHWIIDGFPNTKDDWTAMAEGDLMPYDLIVVRDQTEKFEHIIEKDRINIECVGKYVGYFHPNQSIIKIIKRTLTESLLSAETMN